MKSSELGKLDSALHGLNGLPEDARSADEAIARELGRKVRELLINERGKRPGDADDEAAITLWLGQMTGRVVLDGSTLYNIFELQLKGELSEFWDRLDREKPDLSASGPTFAPPPEKNTRWNMKQGPRFHCSEGCDFFGDELYLAHRDRGHHPVPV